MDLKRVIIAALVTTPATSTAGSIRSEVKDRAKERAISRSEPEHALDRHGPIIGVIVSGSIFYVNHVPLHMALSVAAVLTYPEAFD